MFQYGDSDYVTKGFKMATLTQQQKVPKWQPKLSN